MAADFWPRSVRARVSVQCVVWANYYYFLNNKANIAYSNQYPFWCKRLAAANRNAFPTP